MSSFQAKRISRDELTEAQNALIDEASKGLSRAYAPYSGFHVGAALRGKSGKIYLGCNVENGSFGATICAERSAVVSAVAAGERSFDAIAITATADRPCPPCGICRQVLAEFAPSIEVLLFTHESPEVVVLSLSDLLPLRFRAEVFLELHEKPEGGDR